MEAMRCEGIFWNAAAKPGERRTSSCTVVGSPTTMYAVPVEADFDPDAGLAGAMVPVIGPMCEACARRTWREEEAGIPGPWRGAFPYETFDDTNEPEPTSEDFDDFVDAERDWLTDRVLASMPPEQLERRSVTTSVPYGSTTASWQDVELDDDELVEEARRAWAAHELVWSSAVTLVPDEQGERHCWIARRGDVTRGGEAA